MQSYKTQHTKNFHKKQIINLAAKNSQSLKFRLFIDFQKKIFSQIRRWAKLGPIWTKEGSVHWQ